MTLATSSGWPTRRTESAGPAWAMACVWIEPDTPRGGARHLGVDEAGRDGIDVDVERPKLDGQGLGEALQPRLDAGIVGLAAIAQRRGAAEVDDLAVASAAPCTFAPRGCTKSCP